MNPLSCQTVMQTLGWRCQYLESHRALYVSTPIILPGGAPLDFYLTQETGRIKFTDDGLTLFELRGLGFRLDDNRSTRGLATIAEGYGFELDASGALVGFAKDGDETDLGRRILLMFGRIHGWQEEHFAARDSDQTLADEVERLMRMKAPDVQIEPRPVIRLSTGEDIDFMFRWGKQLIDAIPPDPRATSSRMRKAIQLRKDADDSAALLFIVDDRQKPLKAATEVALLGQIAQAVRLSDFQDHYTVPVFASTH